MNETLTFEKTGNPSDLIKDSIDFIVVGKEYHKDFVTIYFENAIYKSELSVSKKIAYGIRLNKPYTFKMEAVLWKG